MRYDVRFKLHVIRLREIEVERHAVVPRTADSNVEQRPEHCRRQAALDSSLGQAFRAHGEVKARAATRKPAVNPEWELAIVTRVPSPIVTRPLW